MDKLSVDTSASGSLMSASIPTEKRTLSDVLQSTKRSGGNYGSLAKSQVQPTFYISHKVETDDTIQRLALKYSINIQEIKRVNKLWSDAELNLLEFVYIPVNSSQLATLRSLYPTLNVVQSPSPTTNRTRKSSTTSESNDEKTASIPSSDSSTSIPGTTTTTTASTSNSAFQDIFSKIDQQIKSSKKSLQSLDISKQYPKVPTNDSSYRSQTLNGNNSDDSTSSQTSRTSLRHKARNNGGQLPSDNNIFVTIATQNSRERHVVAALERIQREQDDFDEL